MEQETNQNLIQSNTEPPKPKKFWPYLILAAVVLIVLGSILYFQKSRPARLTDNNQPIAPAQNQQSELTLTQFKPQTLPKTFFLNETFTSGYYLYLVGSDNFDPRNSSPNSKEALYFTKIENNGSLADGFKHADLPEGLKAPSFIPFSNKIFLLNYKVIQEGENLSYFAENPDFYIGQAQLDGNVVWKKAPFTLPFKTQGSYYRSLVLDNKLCVWLGGSDAPPVLYVYCSQINQDGTLGNWQKKVEWPFNFVYFSSLIDGNTIYNAQTENGLTKYILDSENNVHTEKWIPIEPSIRGTNFFDNGKRMIYVVENNKDINKGFAKIYAGHLNDEKIGLKEIYAPQPLIETHDIKYAIGYEALYAISSKPNQYNEIIDRSIAVFPLKTVPMEVGSTTEKFPYASIIKIVPFVDSVGTSKKFIMVETGEEGSIISADGYITDANLSTKTAVKISGFGWDTVGSDPLVSISPGPGKKFLLISYQVGDSYPTVLIDEKGLLVSDSVVGNSYELVKEGCQCGFGFERWKDNDEFYVEVRNNNGDYRILIDADSGKTVGTPEKK